MNPRVGAPDLEQILEYRNSNTKANPREQRTSCVIVEKKLNNLAFADKAGYVKFAARHAKKLE